MQGVKDRTILHCDMNNFFASVELLDHPELAGLPVAVCGNPEKRHGIILAKNQVAKNFGVVTAETLWQAEKKCPELILLSPHHEKYRHYSRLINGIYARYTDMVEPFSIDESWLDVTNSEKLFGDGITVAENIRNAVNHELGLTLSIGVSFNKVFAKMGSEYKKPDAITLITRENFKKLLWPMPVSEMFFIGSATSERLGSYGIYKIGELAESDRNFMERLLGKQGIMLHNYANGLDDAPVSPANERRKIKSVGNSITFSRNLIGIDDLRTAALALSDTVGSRLRKYEMKAAGLRVEIREPKFKNISRQKQLDTPTNFTTDIFDNVMFIIEKSWDFDKPVRLLSVTGINLCDEDTGVQLFMFGNTQRENEKNKSLDKTVDKIRCKFGKSAITFGSIIENDIGIELDHSASS